uniref:Uncharacterized protein n=1 Tax=Lepeophtheirus salmonis TaxID=72036 RepID=A0A0K2SVF0_LEPSM
MSVKKAHRYYTHTLTQKLVSFDPGQLNIPLYKTYQKYTL